MLRKLTDHNNPVSARLTGPASHAGAAQDAVLKALLTPHGDRPDTLEEIRWQLEQLPVGFPEVSREDIMQNLPLSILAISGIQECLHTQVSELNRYLQTAAFRYAEIIQGKRKVDIGNGGLKDIPYALNPYIEYSPAGRMLWFLSGKSKPYPDMYRKLCVLQQLEWIIWQSKI